MSALIELDHQLFHLLNSEWTNTFFDAVMPHWRAKETWIPLYIFALIFFIYKFRKQGIYIILGLLCCFGTADTISHKVIKKSVQRARPCHDNSPLEYNRLLLEKCGPGYSFTSNHATNHFALAIFIIGVLGPFYSRLKYFMLFWAATIAYGQVYVGVHFPLDVFCGALLGSLIGYLWALLFNKKIRLKVD